MLAGLVPAAFGAVCGWLLGVDKTAYLVLSILAIAGGYGAGLEHDGAREGAIRGVVGGALFGSFILILHQATGEEAKADLPDPEILLVALTTAFGAGLGALGGRARHQREEAGPKERPAVDFKRLMWAEYVGFAGAAILFGSLFLPWFGTSCDSVSPPSPGGCNVNSVLHGGQHGEFTAWETFTSLDFLLTAACIAPFILAWLIVREASLSWRPGEVTMIVGMIAAALVWLNGIILGRPGDSVDISLAIGYWVGVVGANLILVGGLIRQAVGGRTRKPPGVV
ncbi:MAG TPA: hypothetical protein VF520_09435 [Thermoleophilaceae bacterium]